MIGALIGCGIAAVGGAAIGGYLGTSRGLEAGIRLARGSGGGGGCATYDNWRSYKRDRELLKRQIIQQESERRELKEFLTRIDNKLDQIEKMEQLLFYLSLMTEAEKVVWRNAMFLEMQKEAQIEYEKQEQEKQPMYEALVEKARADAATAAKSNDDSYYSDQHQGIEQVIEYCWWDEYLQSMTSETERYRYEVVLIMRQLSRHAIQLLGGLKTFLSFLSILRKDDVDKSRLIVPEYYK